VMRNQAWYFVAAFILLGLYLWRTNMPLHPQLPLNYTLLRELVTQDLKLKELEASNNQLRAELETRLIDLGAKLEKIYSLPLILAEEQKWDAARLEAMKSIKFLKGLPGPTVSGPLVKNLNMTQDTANYDIYIFGVYTGSSMKELDASLTNATISYNKMWGFDSFQGLPRDTIAQGHEQWTAGNFDASKALETTNWNDLEKLLRQHIGTLAAPYEFIRGFFSDSLTPRLPIEKDMKLALVIDIDTDIYISAKQALDWCFANNLVVPGTLISYDELCQSKLWTTWGDGEARAHKEIAEKYQVHFRGLPGWVSIFVVEKLGPGVTPRTGIEDGYMCK